MLLWNKYLHSTPNTETGSHTALSFTRPGMWVRPYVAGSRNIIQYTNMKEKCPQGAKSTFNCQLSCTPQNMVDEGSTRSVGFEVLTPVVMKSSIFWDLTPSQHSSSIPTFGNTLFVQEWHGVLQLLHIFSKHFSTPYCHIVFYYRYESTTKLVSLYKYIT
jgi:hypothetical protein